MTKYKVFLDDGTVISVTSGESLGSFTSRIFASGVSAKKGEEPMENVDVFYPPHRIKKITAQSIATQKPATQKKEMVKPVKPVKPAKPSPVKPFTKTKASHK